MTGSSAAEDAGVRSGRRSRRSYLDGVLTEQYLRREYVEGRRTAAQLADELGCTHKTVLRYLARYGLPVRGRGQRHGKYAELRSASYLRARYVAEGASVSAIAAELGCSRSSVRAALAAAGIRRLTADPARRLTAEFLLAAYVRDRRSTVDVAAEVGCGPATVTRALRRHGIPVRSRGGAR
jgi:DNA-binding CsgD family transcriptional regulator